MDGVTILNEISTSSTVASDTICIIFGIIFLLICIIECATLVVTHADETDTKEEKRMVIAAICLFIISLVLIFLPLANSTEKQITQYEVTVSDEVSFTEFTDRYEIIEQRGEIYVVKERETNV